MEKLPALTVDCNIGRVGDMSVAFEYVTELGKPIHLSAKLSFGAFPKNREAVSASLPYTSHNIRWWHAGFMVLCLVNGYR